MSETNDIYPTQRVSKTNEDGGEALYYRERAGVIRYALGACAPSKSVAASSLDQSHVQTPSEPTQPKIE